MNSNNFNSIFGIETEEETTEIETVVPEVLEVDNSEDEVKEIDKDFKYARENIKETIETSKEVISEMITVAKQSQHPRAYEVLGNLLKMQIESNKDLLALRKSKKELQPQEAGTGPTTINNNLVMSTHEVLKLIGKQKDSEE